MAVAEFVHQYKKASSERISSAEYSVKGTLTHTPKTDCGSDYDLAGGLTKDTAAFHFKKKNFYIICSLEIEREDGSLFRGNFYVRNNVAKYLIGGLRCEVFIYDDIFVELVVLSDGLGSASNFLLRQGSESYKALSYSALAVSILVSVMLWLPYQPFIDSMHELFGQETEAAHKLGISVISIAASLKALSWTGGLLDYKARLKKRGVVVRGGKPSLKRIESILRKG